MTDKKSTDKVNICLVIVLHVHRIIGANGRKAIDHRRRPNELGCSSIRFSRLRSSPEKQADGFYPSTVLAASVGTGDEK